MTLEKETAGQGVLPSLRCTMARCLVSIAIFSVVCLALALPARASAHTNAHTSLLRTAPMKGALLSTPPGQVRLWFSAVVDGRFSTAVVADGAHEYINTRDASLSPADAREMDVLLPPHLPLGVYTVVWRAVSDSDGLMLGGAYIFAIVQPGQSIPKQSSHPVRPFLDQLGGLVYALPLLATLVAVRLLLFLLLRAPTAEHDERSVTRRPTSQRLERGAPSPTKRLSLRFPQTLCWQSIVGVVVLICLGLGLVQGVSGIFSPARTSPAPVPPLQGDTLLALTAFHAAVRTTDTRFIIVLDVNNGRCCASTFAMSVKDARDGKPMANVSLVLSTTMLDMPMGTDTVNVRSDGKGHFSAQSDLGMGGLWQICMVIRTADHTSQAACVKMLIPY